MGGIVLCFASDEAATWVKRLKKAGREADTCVFGIGAPWRFNFLNHESSIESGGLDHIDNLVNLLMDIVAVRRTAPLGNEASFWLPQKRLLCRSCLSLLLMAGEPLTLKGMNDLIQSAPNTVEEGKNADWQSRSHLFAMLERAEARSGRHSEWEPVMNFWLYTRAKLPDKTRATIDAEFLGMVDGPLSRGKLADLFGTTTNIDPSACFDGKVIIVNVPVEEYREAGQYAALIWATAFMRATMRRAYKAPADRPLFLFADESQAYSIEQDVDYHATCRKKGVCCVRLTQNIPGFVKSYGGGAAAQITVDAILGNLVTKLFLKNSDPTTNAWASKLIAKEMTYKHSLSNSGSLQSNSGFNSSSSVSEVEEASCGEKEFLSLKNGGAQNKHIVEAVLFESGRLWARDQRWIVRKFKQS